MDIIIPIIIVTILIGGPLAFFIFYGNGRFIIQALETINYGPQIGVVITPYIIMNSYEFGSPYSLQAWTSTIIFIIVLLLLSLLIQFIINVLENRAEYLDEKRKLKKEQKDLIQKPERKTFKETLSILLLQASSSAKISVIGLTALIISNEGVEGLLSLLSIGTIMYGILLSILFKYLSTNIN